MERIYLVKGFRLPVFGLFGIGFKLDRTLLKKPLYAVFIWPGALVWQRLLFPWLDHDSALAAGLVAAVVASFAVEVNQGVQYRWDVHNFFGIGDFIVSVIAAALVFAFAAGLI